VPAEQTILQLLFAFAHWHGLAKLCMHTDPTLAFFDHATTLLGAKFPCFVNHTSGKFNTWELQCEVNTHAHRYAKKSATPPSAFSTPIATSSAEPDAITARRTKMFNLKLINTIHSATTWSIFRNMALLIRIVPNQWATHSSLDCYWLTALQQGELEH
jgi:hypothetical protein